ncbi:hypothetical protein [Actinoplanes sp. NPDC051411]|uniref:DUF2207 family protein n=1 Tax=Actinoplanes sp. NPDC051411 TaxID=3155522 RepID=UPI003439827A
MIDLVAVAATLAVWSGIYAMCRVATRPALPPAAPATMDLGPESPALVSFLVGRWSLTEDAAESTLLDLAARKFFELRQPGLDPMQTTVHVPAVAPDASGLRPYESQVLSRIRGLAVGGVVPITALTFRNEAESKSWNSRLRTAVVDEARAAGLSRRRFGKGVVTLLVFSAAAAGVIIGLAAVHYGLGRADDDKPGFGAGLLAFGILSAVAGRAMGERDTPAGREVAARWLGVRDWLRGHDQFDELPPASVAIWDRYLGYGAAVGATRLASAVLDLEMGDKRLVWSSFGGTWHRVRVRYPSFWPRYGRPTSSQVIRGLIVAVAGGLLLRFLSSWSPLPGLVLLLFGVYLLIRAGLDLAMTREITGEVLWRENWKSRSGGEDEPPVPWLDYLAIDDGSADRTVAWGVPIASATSCHDGDTVTVAVRPWSRRVVTLTVVGQGRTRDVTPVAPVAPAASVAVPERPSLFPASDVAQMFGREVTASPIPWGTHYCAADNGKTLLMVQSVSGMGGRLAWRLNSSRGVGHPGGFFINGDIGVYRTGDTTVVANLTGDGRVARAALPWLMEQATHRLRT